MFLLLFDIGQAFFRAEDNGDSGEWHTVYLAPPELLLLSIRNLGRCPFGTDAPGYPIRLIQRRNETDEHQMKRGEIVNVRANSSSVAATGS